MVKEPYDWKGENQMKKFVQLLVLVVVLWPSSLPYSEVGYSWSPRMVRKSVRTTVAFIVTYPKGTALGAGVVISKSGRVLTAAHLFDPDDYTGVKMIMWNGAEYDAHVLSKNSRVDLALTEPIASAQSFEYARIQKSNFLFVGEDLLIVGHPYGAAWTVTVGIITRLVWNIFYATRMMETDALVNSGNSGGPVFNTDGEVVGILSAKYILSGIGIIVPVNEIHRFLNAYEAKAVPSQQIKRYSLGGIK